LVVLTPEEFATAFIGAVFDHYIDAVEFDIDESPFSFWRVSLNTKISIEGCNEGKQFSL
jgi:hypothetical protein